MNIQTDKMYMVFRRDFEDKTYYKIGLSKKKQDGTYERAYIPVQFKKDVELDNQTNIYLKSAWLTFYKNKEGKEVFYIFVNEFNTVSDEVNEYQDMNIKTQEVKSNTLDLSIDPSELPF